MQHQNIFAVIPAYNAADTIQEVVLDLQDTLHDIRVIVVNDGSTDGTREILNKVDNIICLENEQNSGKGFALRRGFDVAIAKNADVILTLDADGQHCPKESKKFVDKIEQDNFDLVIGSRMHDTSTMPTHRFLSNAITSKLVSWRVKQPITDSQSGFRLYKTEMLRSTLLNTKHFDFETEVLIKCALAGFRIGCVDITTIYPQNQTSSIKAVDILRFVRLYWQSLFW